jgi:hypothetical protein
MSMERSTLAGNSAWNRAGFALSVIADGCQGSGSSSLRRRCGGSTDLVQAGAPPVHVEGVGPGPPTVRLRLGTERSVQTLRVEDVDEMVRALRAA